MWKISERLKEMINKEYLIKEKYCPSRKMNVPVMVFSDSSLSPQCWDSNVCKENCSYSCRKNNENSIQNKTDM